MLELPTIYKIHVKIKDIPGFTYLSYSTLRKLSET